ncbi:MAG TPA: hypothetical protein DEB16_06145 [Ruminococcaceae bacterium]|jgi:hypothetical protein|nr:hypothetical protein [Oscillospiraceae bacterium]HBG55201.1 hypothetical protein [Oscillospiraceae bacterium]HBQ46194.1 hypothetical protein [Oscillospiraceae bacterium]HBT91407.1 hypothetical protein [Oscillospiraceae bacterium]HCB91217.1 hypothetical protein [Oscillospiraceae bacterium]
MACFLAPAAEAIAVTIVKKCLEKREVKLAAARPKAALADRRSGGRPEERRPETGIPWSRKLNWLTNLLWGGVFLLAVEHIWHGEVVPWPPFLTAMSSPADVGPMLHEIATVGVTMAAFVTAVWGALVLAADRLCRKAAGRAAREG